MIRIYDKIIKKLPKRPDSSRHEIWVNSDDEIMCVDEKTANVIADFLEEMGYDVIHTRLREREDDGEACGWWAVYVDGM